MAGSNQIRYSSSSDKGKRELLEPRPSSSVVLLSPQNEVLLLHRVQTSTSFASAHVFPGGNLDPFHDGDIPEPGSPGRHTDGPAYRLGAIRETFEETGILLAKKDGELVDLSVEERNAARKQIHGNQVKFLDFLKSIGAEPDVGALFPFTRWITPAINAKRFTTQMYVYMLPLSRSHAASSMLVPTPDDGIEHTAADFAPVQSFLARTATNSASPIILFPPQFYLLTLIARVFAGPSGSIEEGPLQASVQRRRLLKFLRRVPTAETDRGKQHPTAAISWADKVMNPQTLVMRKSDGKVVLGLEKPGPELKDTGRGGDWERVVLVNFGKGGPTDVEIRRREDVLKEEREFDKDCEKL